MIFIELQNVDFAQAIVNFNYVFTYPFPLNFYCQIKQIINYKIVVVDTDFEEKAEFFILDFPEQAKRNPCLLNVICYFIKLQSIVQ